MDGGLVPTWDALTQLPPPGQRISASKSLRTAHSDGSLRLPHIVASKRKATKLKSYASQPRLVSPVRSTQGPMQNIGRPPLAPSPQVNEWLQSGKVLLGHELQKLKADFAAAQQLAARDPKFAQVFKRAQEDFPVREEVVNAWYLHYKQRFGVGQDGVSATIRAEAPRGVAHRAAATRTRVGPTKAQRDRNTSWNPKGGGSLQAVSSTSSLFADELKSHGEVALPQVAAASQGAGVAAAAARTSAQEARDAADEARNSVTAIFAQFKLMAAQLSDKEVDGYVGGVTAEDFRGDSPYSLRPPSEATSVRRYRLT